LLHFTLLTLLIISATRSAITFFFFNDTVTTEIYTLSLHDALPILAVYVVLDPGIPAVSPGGFESIAGRDDLIEAGRCQGLIRSRSEEHTSELQSLTNLVCRLLLEKKKKKDGRRARPHLKETLVTYL